ncbi:MAG: hypothetical protein R3F59_22355 [Myxococcota bacterium]
MIPWLVRLGPGCLEFVIDSRDPVDPPPQQIAVTESFVQAPLPKADLLLVIDDTASMAQEQAALSQDFAVLLDELDALGVGWQLGVVSTEMVKPEAGLLRGTPWILTPSVPQRELVFAEMVQVGLEGDGPEAGLAAAERTLALAVEGPNAGFRRPDALLNVIFVSDADDESDDWLGSDPVGPFLDLLADEAERTGLPARASGLIGPPPSGCHSISGQAQPAVRYAEAIAASGGVQGSICAIDFAAVLAQLSEATIAWQTEFPLRERPADGSVRIRIDDALVEGGWAVADEPPRLVFDEAPPPASQIDVSYLVTLAGPR